MTHNRPTRRIAVAALTAAALIGGLSACGSDDDTSNNSSGNNSAGAAPAAGGTQLKNDCTMVLDPVTGVAQGIASYQYSGKADDLLVNDATVKNATTYAAIVKDSELKSSLEKSGTNNEKFNAAIKAGDTKTRDKVFAEQKEIGRAHV